MKRTVLDYALKIRLPITFFVIIISFMITFYVSRPERDGVGYSPIQPIKYSHKLHAGQMNMDCKFCHIGTEKGRFALIPSTNICMSCHNIARKDRPEIIKLKQYFDDNQPIPWKRIHKLPEYAYFNHSSHVNKKIDCVTCHGDIKQMEVVNQVKPWTMTACLDCHKEPNKYISYIKNMKQGPTYCSACHR